METTYHLSNLPNPESYNDLAKDLLEASFQFDLHPFENVNRGESHAQFYTKGEAMVLVQVRTASEIKVNSRNELNSSIVNDINIYDTERYILLCFEDVDWPELDTDLLIRKSSNPKFNYYNLSWVEEQLQKHPEIAENHNIRLEGNSKEQKKSVPITISKTDNPSPSYWAGGYHWGDDNPQLERFLNNNIWEIGWGNDDPKGKQSYNLIEKIKVNDFIALKSLGGSYILRIAAIGRVTNIAASEDGQLGVKWIKKEGLYHGSAPKGQGAGNWFGTLLQITREDVIENLFTEVLAEDFKGEVVDDTNDSNRYWWINANEKFWNIDAYKIGDEQSYATHHENGTKTEVFRHFFEAKKGDFGIVYKTGPSGGTKAIIEITKEAENKNGDDVRFKVIYKFKEDEEFSFAQLKAKEFFRQSEVIKRNNQASLFKLTKEEYKAIVSSTSFLSYPVSEDIFQIKTSLDNDGAYTTKDLLDIENDVRSFALILASKEIKPPLAVALFGKWGSGKSFFMEHLSKRVDELSINQGFLEEGEESQSNEEENKEEHFCKGIAQIKFNAWSYLDANLWAGLVTNIFEKLDEYITGNNVKEAEKRKVHNKVSESLTIVQNEKNILSKEINELNKEKKSIGGKLKDLIEGKNELDKQVLQKSLEDLKKEAREHIEDLERDVKIQLDKYGITQQRIQELSPSSLLDEVSSWLTFVKNIGKLNKTYISIVTILVVLLVSYSGLTLFNLDPGGYFSELKEFMNLKMALFISTISPFFVKIYSSYSKFKKVFQPVVEFKDKFNESFDKVKLDYDTTLNTYNTEIAKKEKAINEKQVELEKVNTQIDHYEYELNHSITKRAFNNFIKRKSNDENYQKHLGLISIIRKDFETLSALFEEVILPRGISPEERRKLEERKKESDEFRGYFKKPLDRIILYIDDLDRCSDEKVLEVIQAVHLLMAFPLFNVVVGVDKRCVNNALIYKNLLQYSKFTGLDEIYKTGIHVISPSEYLEKIFQIPFQLEDPSDKNIKNMVGSFLNNQIEEETIEPTTPQIDVEKKETDDLNLVSSKKTDASVKKIESKEIPTTDQPEETKKKVVTPKDLKLTKDEVELLKEMVCLVGSIPRTVKRFLNIYRIIRAHQDLNIDQNEKRKELLAIMFILAINIGENKKHAPELMECIESNKDLRLTDIVDHDDLKDSKTKYMYFNEIRVKIERIESIRELNHMKAEIFSKHIPLVGRFSFGSIECNGEQEQIQKNMEEVNAK